MSKYVRDKSHCKHETYTKEDIVNTIYPIGSIYIGVNETNPSTLFGGTWEQIKDTFLLSAGDKYGAGSTGGEAEHVLTIEEMPRHRHIQYNMKSGLLSAEEKGTNYEVVSIRNNEVYTGYEGSGEAHNNMPPYLAVYMWKRIS